MDRLRPLSTKESRAPASLRKVLVRGRTAALVGVLAIAAGYACGPSISQGRRDFNLIDRDELQSTHFHNAFEAVQALHSNWLLTRPNSFLAQANVLVYVDNIRLGDVSELQNIALGPIQYVRYFDPLEATTRWGVGHDQGVIYLSTHPLVWKGQAAWY